MTSQVGFHGNEKKEKFCCGNRAASLRRKSGITTSLARSDQEDLVKLSVLYWSFFFFFLLPACFFVMQDNRGGLKRRLCPYFRMWRRRLERLPDTVEALN